MTRWTPKATFHLFLEFLEQSNNSRYQMETDFLCAIRFQAGKSALAKVHLLMAVATVGTLLRSNGF